LGREGWPQREEDVADACVDAVAWGVVVARIVAGDFMASGAVRIAGVSKIVGMSMVLRA
jgi:hypothetical protein